jgi:hypothetical protein
MLITLMTGLAIWTSISVVVALIAGRVISYHERVEHLQPLAETVRDYLNPPVPVRQT